MSDKIGSVGNIDYGYSPPTLEQIKSYKHLGFYITKEEIENKNLNRISEYIKHIKQFGSEGKNKILLSIKGYGNIPDELYTIEAVREYMKLLHIEFPDLIYFLNDYSSQSYLFCVLDIIAYHQQISIDPTQPLAKEIDQAVEAYALFVKDQNPKTVREVLTKKIEVPAIDEEAKKKAEKILNEFENAEKFDF